MSLFKGGTLRWQAPEIIVGESSGQLTYQVDIYAYAIVCVEIFGEGGLPWGIVDDDAYRRLVIGVCISLRSYCHTIQALSEEEDKRPPITYPNVSKGILEIIEMCWDRDPSKRPTFQKIIRELKTLGLSKYADSPSLGGKSRLFDDSVRRKQSPDMKPIPLPDGWCPCYYTNCLMR